MLEYTYKGKNYPSEVTLKHPEIESILSKNPIDITRREFDSIIEMGPDEITKDEENLILREIGRQFGKNTEQLKADETANPYFIHNILITLMTTYEKSSFDVVLEILRQSEDIINFDLPDYKGFTYIQPMLTNIFEYEPKMLEGFMLEEGISVRGKQIVAEFLSRMISQKEYANEELRNTIRKRLVTIFGNILKAYIADNQSGKICDKEVVSYVVKAIVNLGLKELSDQLKSVYDKEMVDQQMCGNLDLNISVMKELGHGDMNYIETGIYPLMFMLVDLLWDNPDNTDFGEQEIYKVNA